MARIPVYEQQTSVGGGASIPRATAEDFGALQGQAIQQAGQALGQLAQGLERRQSNIERKRQEDAQAWVASALPQDRIKWIDMQQADETAAAPGAPNFAQDQLKKFQKYRQEAINRAPTPEAKKFYAERLDALGVSVFDQSVRFEANAGVKWRIQQWGDAQRNIEILAAKDPQQAKISLAEQEAILDNSPNQEIAQLHKRQLREAVARAAAQGEVERDPVEALRKLDSYFGVRPKSVIKTSGDFGQLFDALIQQESGARHVDAQGRLITSSAGAQGITQLMPETARNPGYGITPVKDQSEAEYRRVGSEYLQAMLKVFKGDTAKALAAYNAGPGAVEKAVSKDPQNWLSRLPAETQDYVQRISSNVKSEGPMLASGDPMAALNAIKPQGTGDAFIDMLSPHEAWQMRNRAQADVNRMMAERKAAQIESDRAAQELVGQVTNMMRDGYTPNPALLSQAQALSAGTRFAAPLFQAQQEFQVTSAFRNMSPAQQQQYLNTNRANVDDPQKAGLYEQLLKIQSQDAAHLKSDPWSYVAQKPWVGAVEPINWGDPVTDASKIQRRVQQARMAANTIGQEVPPLSTEEGQALRSQLERLQPSQVLDYYGVLGQSLKDPGAYRQVMKVIAPDSPTRATAGILAGMRQDLVSVTLDPGGLLSSKVTATPRKVAETILAGENIVNRSRQQRGEEGKGQFGMLLAPAELFDEAFASETGNLYRGRPEALSIDRQNAYAYYVGRSAELGRLNESRKDINTALLREAIRATTGDVQDIHGQGYVRAPYGMTGDVFKSEAQKAFRDAVTAEGLPDAVKDKWPQYGLQNLTDNRYQLTLGGSPVVGKRGPVILRIGISSAELMTPRAEIPR